MSRTCHKTVFHFAFLLKLHILYVNDLRLRIKFDTPGQEVREEEIEYKSIFKIREQ